MSNYHPPGQTKKEYCRAYYARNKNLFLDAQLRLVYGITRQQYDLLYAAQGGCCKICGSTGCGTKRTHKLYVDHINTPNGPHVRGLLCHKCNCALGMLGDNEEGLARALAYVRGQP